jgi:hypothetical protein
MIAVAAAFAVVGEIVSGFVSASQIDKWLECERMWGWRYIARIKDPAGAAAALGTECDDTQLQPYLRDGRAIDYSRRSGYIVQPGLAYLPKPKSAGIELQRHFVIPSPTTPGLSFQGYVDLWVPDASVMPDLAYDPKQGPRVLEDGFAPPVVDDFKTTGNWKYQKTPKILATDTQAQIYAKWAMVHTGAPVVDLIWTYFGTKGAYKARRSHLRVTAEHVDAEFARINAVAETIHAHRKRRTNPLELLPNVDACEKFYGCPYRANCNLSPSQIIDAKAAQHARRQQETPTNMSNVPSTTTGTLARLKAQKAAALAAGGGAPAPETTKAGIPIANLPSHALAAPSVMGCAPTDVPAPTEIHAKFLGINPPEKDLPPAPAVGSVQAPPPAPVQIAAPSTAVGQSASADTPSNVSEPVPAGVPVFRGGVAVGVTVPPGTTPPTPEQVAVVVETANAEQKAKRGPGRPRKAPLDPVGADAALHAGEPTLEQINATIETLKSIPVDAPETVRATWGREKFSPVSYNDFDIGPFEATGTVQPGETVGQAQARVYAELEAFAEEARARKAISYQKTLAAFGGSR